MIIGVEGQFGSGKTSYCVNVARSLAIKKLAIETGKKEPKTLIFSNIKMDKEKIGNYIYFDDNAILDILRQTNLINDIERTLFSKFDKISGLFKHNRGGYTKLKIFFDEAGALMNGANYKNRDNRLSEYINQNRKNFLDVYIATADGSQADKSLRRFCERWYYSKPLFNFPILRDIKIIRRMKKDDEDKPAFESYLAKDEQGDYIVKQKPIDEYVCWYWQPGVWNLYDDLHKNIQDPDKYEIDSKLFKQILLSKPSLIKPFKENILTLFKDKKREELNTMLSQLPEAPQRIESKHWLASIWGQIKQKFNKKINFNPSKKG